MYYVIKLVSKSVSVILRSIVITIVSIEARVITRYIIGSSRHFTWNTHSIQVVNIDVVVIWNRVKTSDCCVGSSRHFPRDFRICAVIVIVLEVTLVKMNLVVVVDVVVFIIVIIVIIGVIIHSL